MLACLYICSKFGITLEKRRRKGQDVSTMGRPQTVYASPCPTRQRVHPGINMAPNRDETRADTVDDGAVGDSIQPGSGAISCCKEGSRCDSSRTMIVLGSIEPHPRIMIAICASVNRVTSRNTRRFGSQRKALYVSYIEQTLTRELSE